MLLLLLSRQSSTQWACWEAVRALSTVSAEAAQHVAQHGSGIVQLPSDMVQTLNGYFQDAGLTGKAAKLRSRALTEQLKALGRSQARGGLQPYRQPDTGTDVAAAAATRGQQVMTAEQLQEQEEMESNLEQMAAAFGTEALQQHRAAREAAHAAAALPLARTKSGRLKASARAALLAHAERHGLLALPHEAARAALGLPPSESLDSPARTAAVKQATPAYNEGQALTYALSRLPACYAAAARVFRELGVRQADFRPQGLLDVGAGPGTATWAAQEVWSGSLRRVTAVEPSAAMRRLGVRLEAARRFSQEAPPLVRWQAELPQEPRLRQQQRQQRFDLVVASYVLGELPSPKERIALVKRLWSWTSDVLVLLEPGTPAGAANILEARAAVLQREERRAAKLHMRQAADSSSDDAGGSGSSSVADGNLAQKSSSRWFGAHVVSPCPHDGPCPMAAPGSKAWCHFGSRFHRPPFMQAAKAPTGRAVNPANHQDERFSYVVLRRGARPAVHADVDISRTFWAQLQQQQEDGSTDIATSASEQQKQQQQQVVGVDHLSRTNKRLNLFGEGLVNRLMALEDVGIDWTGSADGLSSEVAALAAAQQAPDTTQQQLAMRPQPGHTPSSVQTHSAESSGIGASSQQLKTWPLQEPQLHQQQHPSDQRLLQEPLQLTPAEVEAAAASSSTWSRITRPPRKRGGHVILDLCVAGGGSQEVDTNQGQLQRHIIARSDIHKMGKAVYSMAQSAKWGDLWPRTFNRNKKRQVVHVSSHDKVHGM